MKSLNKRSKSRFRSSMTDTQTLIILLAKSFSLTQDFIIYLDNLFINIFLAKTLKKLDIEVIRMTHITALELSLSLIQLKHAKQSLK